MNYYVEQKFVNGQPIEMYYIRKSGLMPMNPKLGLDFDDFETVKKYCDQLNHPPKTEYKKVYP